MAITLSREAYLEFRCFGMADQTPRRPTASGPDKPVRSPD